MHLFAPSIWYMRVSRMLLLCIPLAIASAATITTLLSEILSDTELDFLVQAAVYVAVTMATLIETQLLPCGSSRASGLLMSRQSPQHMFRGAVSAITILAAIAICAILFGAVFQPVELVSNPTLVVCLVASSMGEEVLFRGTVLQALNQRFGPIVANVATSIAFACVHLGNPHVDIVALWSTFVVGLLLGAMALQTSSLWMPMSFHAVWNILSAGIFGVVSGLAPVWQISYLDTSGVCVPSWVIGGNYGIESGVVAVVFITITFGVIPKLCVPDPFVKAARYRIDVCNPSNNQRHRFTSYVV